MSRLYSWLLRGVRESYCVKRVDRLKQVQLDSLIGFKLNTAIASIYTE